MVWKIIATIVIVFGVIILVLSSNPAVSSFFQQVNEKITNVLGYEFDVNRNVSFSLILNRYVDASFYGKGLVLDITPKTLTGEINGMKIDTNKGIKLIGFNGSGSISGNNLTLDGKFEKLTSEMLIESGSIKISTAFENLTVENLALKEIKVKASGYLDAGEIKTKLSDTMIELYYPSGKFEFYNNQLRINGLAKKISIPEIKLEIG
ncbi:MAG: hypothetical protein V1900_01355 [Candidatus Aenigmatarchaeota archaeon]